MKRHYIIGIDLGATQLRFIAAKSETGEIKGLQSQNRGKYFFPSPFKKVGDGCFVDNLFEGMPLFKRISAYLAEKLNVFLKKVSLKKGQLTGIGVSVPGRILPGDRFLGANTPLIYATKNKYGHYGIDVITTIKGQFKGLKIAMDNDANCAGLAQGIYYKSLGIDPYSTFYITISTGIGGGGPKRDIDEVGHIPVDGGFPKLIPRCGCGAYGCLEAYASGEGILKQALAILHLYREYKTTFKEFGAYETLRLDRPTHLSAAIEASDLKQEYVRGRQLSAALIFRKAALGRKTGFDPFARYLIETAAARTAKVIVAISHVHGLTRIGVGGSVALKNPKYIELISREVSKTFWRTPYIIQKEVTTELSPLGNYVNDYGALSLVLDRKYMDRWVLSMKALAHSGK